MGLNFLARTMSVMSTESKDKLGTVGTKVNTPGAHAVTIDNFFIGEYDGKPNVQIAFSENGKLVEWIGNLVTQVNYKDGAPTKKSYTYGGEPLINPAEKAPCDNTQTLGRVKTLFALLGTTIEAESAKAVTQTVKSFGKELEADVYVSMIGKSLTIVTSTELSANDKGTPWHNQSVSMDNIFTAAGLSKLESDTGVTEGKALAAAVAVAAEPQAQFADIGYRIKYKDQSDKKCSQELKVLQMGNTIPKPVVSEEDDGEDF